MKAVDLNSTKPCIFASEEYAMDVLGLSDDISWSNFGGLQWELLGCLFAAWLAVYLCVFAGVRSSGKVVYFTATFPYVVLVVLFGWGVSLPGALEGVQALFWFDASKLGEVATWYEAAVQVFYSLSLGLGGIIALSSHNSKSFQSNCQRHAVIITAVDTATSLFAGSAVFAILGSMAHSVGVDIDQVTEKGPKLAFVIIPEALAKTKIPQLWSALFFVMIITLAIDSMIPMIWVVTTTILDHFNWHGRHKRSVALGTCALGFLCGLSMVARGGFYMVDLFDKSAASFNLLMFAFLEVSFTAWQYGTANLVKNLGEMGIKLSGPVRWYWTLCWQAFTPLTLGAVMMCELAEVVNSGVLFDLSDNDYPAVQVLGLLIFLSSAAMLPLFAFRPIRKKYREVGNWNLAVDLVHKPLPEWRRRALLKEDVMERENDT